MDTQMKDIKQAWVLTGGGGNGAFQAGAMKWLYDEGYRPDLVVGVSVGALNGLAIACDRINLMSQLWYTIKDEDVYRKRGLFGLGIRQLLSKIRLSSAPSSIYDHSPLRKYLEQHVKGWVIQKTLIIKTVDIERGDVLQHKFVEGREVDDEVINAVMAASAIPVIFEPQVIKVDSIIYNENTNELQYRKLSDAGVRQIAPLKTITSLHKADNSSFRQKVNSVVVISCSPYNDIAKEKINNLQDTAKRSIELLIRSVLISDIKEYQLKNRLAEHETNYTYFPTAVIAPDQDLGGSLDFDQTLNRSRFQKGAKAASEEMSNNDEFV